MYQAVALRFFVPFEERLPGNGFTRLPTEAYQARRALEAFRSVAGEGAVLEFNPIDPKPGARGDVVPPYTFYARSVMMNAGRQLC